MIIAKSVSRLDINAFRCVLPSSEAGLCTKDVFSYFSCNGEKNKTIDFYLLPPAQGTGRDSFNRDNLTGS